MTLLFQQHVCRSPATIGTAYPAQAGVACELRMARNVDSSPPATARVSIRARAAARPSPRAQAKEGLRPQRAAWVARQITGPRSGRPRVTGPIEHEDSY